ncbi:MAG: hypothetical protein OXE96_16270 [Gemmatimonadetes bacterium]|nr:hypothetical protein [Gemmatimonadota bacterium]
MYDTQAGTRRVLRRVKAFIEHGWTQCRSVAPKRDGTYCYCLSAALSEACARDDDCRPSVRHRALLLLYRAITGKANTAGPGPMRWGNAIVLWNDHYKRTHEDVVQAVHKAIELNDEHCSGCGAPKVGGTCVCDQIAPTTPTHYGPPDHVPAMPS